MSNCGERWEPRPLGPDLMCSSLLLSQVTHVALYQAYFVFRELVFVRGHLVFSFSDDGDALLHAEFPHNIGAQIGDVPLMSDESVAGTICGVAAHTIFFEYLLSWIHNLARLGLPLRGRRGFFGRFPLGYQHRAYTQEQK